MSKRHKSTVKKQKVNAKRDRISDLPDAILAHILGKLPTKNAVGTSILSTRWKGLFAQIPNPDISITDEDFPCSDEDSDFDTRDLNFHRQKANFIDFMYNLLNVILHDVPRIRKFHLDLCINYDYDEKKPTEEGYFCHDHVNKWISAALKLNVSYLWFFCPSNYNVSPDGLFNCASLVEIMLHWNAGISVPSSVFLPNLKCLYLKQVLFHNDDLREVLSGCPVLEELCLCYCGFSKRNVNDTVVVRVFSNSVKKFRWFRCIKDYRYGIELDMSALDSLCYNDYLPDYFLVKNLNSLRKAYIDPWPNLDQLEGYGGENRERYLKSVADLVQGCSNVDFLSFTDHFVEAISCTYTSLKPFHYLVYLELPKIIECGWQLLPYLLINAPNLELLVFAKGFRLFKGGYKLFLSHMRQCPKWLAMNLKRIDFDRFDGEEDEMKLVKYFLNNAKGLRKIEIKLSLLSFKAAMKVEELQKKSKKCDIELKFGVFSERERNSDPSFGMREW